MALSNQAFNVREQEGGKGRERETERERKIKQRHKICHHHRHFKSFVMCLFVSAYSSKFNLGQELEEAPESEHQFISQPPVKCNHCVN